MDADARIAALVAEARATVPELTFDDAELAAFLRARIHHGELHAGDLAIAMRCARGDEKAIALFEARCFGEIPFAHARVRSRATIEEIRQMMRAKLFVPSGPGEPPKIAHYTGVGTLRAWFRVGLVRALLNLATRSKEKSELPLEDAMLEAMPQGGFDPEMEHARRTYEPAIREAFAEAIARLDRRERAVLRFAVCDGLNVDSVGEIYGVHRATAARWVAAAKDKLEEHVRIALRARIRAGDDSLASVMRLAGSKVELSLRRHLATGVPSE